MAKGRDRRQIKSGRNHGCKYAIIVGHIKFVIEKIDRRTVDCQAAACFQRLQGVANEQRIALRRSVNRPCDPAAHPPRWEHVAQQGL